MVAAPFDILPGLFVLSLLRAARVRKLFAWQETLLLSVICVAQLLLHCFELRFTTFSAEQALVILDLGCCSDSSPCERSACFPEALKSVCAGTALRKVT